MNTDGIIAIGSVAAILLLAGGMIGFVDRRNFHWRWLLVSAALVLIEDALLLRGYGFVPSLLPAASWNWQGKILSLAATLAIATLPAFGWRRVGLTLKQNREGWPLTLIVVLALAGLYAWLALGQPNDPFDAETFAFQTTMPGLEEEAFYSGTLLYALNKTFTGRVRFLGAEWGLAIPFAAILFGFAHAFGYSDGEFSFDWMTMVLVAWPAPIVYWVRLRSGSILMPVLLHNFVNSIGQLI